MLNGRVYGRRRPYNKASTDPFAIVRDAEPEFVEWGYGGMGSNKSNTNSSMGSAWKAVQNGTNASTFGNDEDDASGMAWVKKRRAAREKAKLEVEKLQDQPGDSEVENAQPTAADEPVHGTPEPLEENQLPQPVAETPIAAPVEQHREKPEHITTAVNLPPHRAHKREPSFGHRIQIPQVAESPIKEKPSFGDDVFDMDLSVRPESPPPVPEPDADSTSEDEEDSSIDGDDEDESDSYSEENAHSKTALGAGVEKVSRHKDIPQPKAPNLPHSTPKNQLPATTIEA